MLAECAPFHDGIVIANSSIQRSLIECAAKPFGFDAYPTKYGSSYIRLDAYDAVVPSPGKKSDKASRRYAEAAKAYGSLASSMENVNWTLALIDDCANSSLLSEFVPNSIDYQFIREAITPELPEECKFVDLEMSDESRLFKRYFRTDHHWRIEAAVEAYRRIAEAMDIDDPVQFSAPHDATGPLFYGSLARRGVDIGVAPDSVTDVDYNRSDFTVVANGEPKDDTFLDYGYTGQEYTRRTLFEDVYNGYFHSYQAEMHFHNESMSEGKLLIVDDSFGHCMERFFAESYRDVYVIDRRSYQGTVRKLVEDNGIDDVLFLVCESTFTDDASLEMLE